MFSPKPDFAETAAFVTNLFRGVLRREPDPSALAHYVDALRGGCSPASVVQELVTCEEFRQKTSVTLFCPPGHFYSPIVDPVEAERHLAAIEAAPAPERLPGIAISRSEMVATWNTLLPYLRTIPFPDEQEPGFRFWFDNPAYSWGDASILHAMLRHSRPRRLIEVGSGWSSACTIDTVERYLGNTVEMTFIEPYPDLLKSLAGNAAERVRIIESPLQRAPLSLFEELEADDILFIDSTHVLRTGSDVCFALFEILPRIRSGVIVHIHDMFWPFEYPRPWVIGENRSWNELYAMRAFLYENQKWKVEMFLDYFARFERPLIEATYPALLKNPGGALWLRRC